jgi:uncharacterized protein YegL
MPNVNYASNLSQRTPCLLVLDGSQSMSFSDSSGNTRIGLLNDGLKTFHQALKEDELALSRVQIACVNVGGPTEIPDILMDWCDATEFFPFTLTTGHATPLGAGISLGLDLIDQQKTALRESGISFTRPWMFVFTDGEPTDNFRDWDKACAAAKNAEESGSVEIFTIGIGDANLEKLAEVSVRPPIMLDGVKFREFFVWLSASLGQVTRSTPGDKIDLPSTDPWASVKL